MIAFQPDLLWIGGDFSYSDQWADNATRVSFAAYGTLSYQPKQDAWGRLFEPLLSAVPFVHVDGNHEIEQVGCSWQRSSNPPPHACVRCTFRTHCAIDDEARAPCRA